MQTAAMFAAAIAVAVTSAYLVLAEVAGLVEQTLSQLP